MTQQEKALATKSDDLSSDSRAHTMWDDSSAHSPLTSKHVPHHTNAHTHENKCNFLKTFFVIGLNPICNSIEREKKDLESED